MRLVVRQGNHVVNEFQFAKGPVTIGRRSDCQVVLANGTVSKKHAVISCNDDGKWSVEDAGSANKTYLDEKVIQKAEVKSGDVIRIADFNITINLEGEEKKGEPEQSTQMEDTIHLHAALTTPVHETIIRKPDAAHAPAMRLPANRITDFSQATEIIAKTQSLDQLIPSLLNIILRQFSAYRCWCAIRNQPNGPMMFHAGKRRDGLKVELDDIQLKDKIEQAIERGQSLVLPRVSAQMQETDRIRSALIATIMRSSGCCGVLYIDNAMIHEHYSLSDLDYLMFLAIHIASILKDI